MSRLFLGGDCSIAGEESRQPQPVVVTQAAILPPVAVTSSIHQRSNSHQVLVFSEIYLRTPHIPTVPIAPDPCTQWDEVLAVVDHPSLLSAMWLSPQRFICFVASPTPSSQTIPHPVVPLRPRSLFHDPDAPSARLITVRDGQPSTYQGLSQCGQMISCCWASEWAMGVSPVHL